MKRLNKYLAEHGYSSRRGADKLIEEGAVTVNGAVATLGMQVSDDDLVEVSSQLLERKEEEKRYFILNKPVGYVTSTKRTKDEGSIFLDLFPEDFPRVFPVGRLDKDSQGLLLITNDGDITYKLTHPSFEHEKEYFVEMFNPLTDGMIERLEKPFAMLGQKTRPATVKRAGRSSFLITLKEGKNRQIRRMVRAIGSGVKVLKRVRIGKLSLPKDLRVGKWKEISKGELEKFFG